MNHRTKEIEDFVKQLADRVDMVRHEMEEKTTLFHEHFCDDREGEDHDMLFMIFIFNCVAEELQEREKAETRVERFNFFLNNSPNMN